MIWKERRAVGPAHSPRSASGGRWTVGGQPWAPPCAPPPTMKRCRGPHRRARNCSDVAFLMLRKPRAPHPTGCRARDRVLPPCALREAPRAACHPWGPCTSGHREPRSPPGSGAGGYGMEPTDCQDPNRGPQPSRGSSRLQGQDLSCARLPHFTHASPSHKPPWHLLFDLPPEEPVTLSSMSVMFMQ